MRKADILLIFILLLASLCFLNFFNDVNEPQSVSIVSDGVLVGTYPIKDDRVINVSALLGKFVVNIKDKNVWVSESNCKDLLEIKQGKINKSGQSLVCVPNRIVISITGREAVESVTY